MKQRQFEFTSEDAEVKFLKELTGEKNMERVSKAKAAMRAAKEAHEQVKIHTLTIGDQVYEVTLKNKPNVTELSLDALKQMSTQLSPPVNNKAFDYGLLKNKFFKDLTRPMKW